MAGVRECVALFMEGSDRIHFTHLPRDETALANLSAFTSPLHQFSETLKSYNRVFERNESLAVRRGELLFGSLLSQQVDKMFSAPTPEAIEGPPTTWTELALGPDKLSPHDTPGLYSFQNTVIRLTEADFRLIVSGRPRQFLTPWPPKDDTLKELQVLDDVLSEVAQMMKMVSTRKTANLTSLDR
jgi:hypothetical protein